MQFYSENTIFLLSTNSRFVPQWTLFWAQLGTEWLSQTWSPWYDLLFVLSGLTSISRVWYRQIYDLRVWLGIKKQLSIYLKHGIVVHHQRPECFVAVLDCWQLSWWSRSQWRLKSSGYIFWKSHRGGGGVNLQHQATYLVYLIFTVECFNLLHISYRTS